MAKLADAHGLEPCEVTLLEVRVLSSAQMNQKILNKNEILQGPSPKCLNTLKKIGKKQLSRYNDDFFQSRLKLKLASYFNFPISQIIVGQGLEDILRIFFNALAPNKDVVLTHDRHFGYYDDYLSFRGIGVKTFNNQIADGEFNFDINDCIKKNKEYQPKLVVITSPNNPTGNVISPHDFSKIAKAVNPKSILLLDEAYFGFNKDYKQSDFLNIVNNFPNVVILRSFSKLYALAGIRIGFALCGSEIKKLIKYQDLYLGHSRVSEEVAIAALESKFYYKNLSQEIIQTRDHFIRETQKLKIYKIFQSKANFVFMKVLNPKAVKKLKITSKKLKVIPYKFIDDSFLRVSISRKKDMLELLSLLTNIEHGIKTPGKNLNS